MADKQKQSKNKVGYMIFSVAAAIFIWAGIGYTSDRDITKTFRNVDIQVNGSTTLKSKGLVVTDIDTDRISYKMSGKRNDLVNSMNGITLEVDVSQISEEGTYELAYSVKESNPRLELDIPFESITVEVGSYVEKEIPIEIRQLGVTKDRLVQSESDIKSVVIAGAEDEVDNVAKGVISIDVSDIEHDCDYMVKYLLVDQNGNLITQNDTIESEISEIKVVNKVYTAETLPVSLMLSSELSSEYIIDETSTVIAPQSITVGVEDGYSFENVNIVITSINGDTFEYEFADEEGMYIPENVKNINVNLSVVQREDA